MSVEVTRFQLASTALTVTLKAPPAVCADGVPVLPEAVPGAAVSPGIRICSFANAPALIVVDGLVLAVLVPLLMSVAVKVALPAVFGVTESVFVPATSAALAGSVAFASVEVIPTVSVALTRFQLASTAVDGDVEGSCRRSERSACRSCRWRCRVQRSRPGSRIWSFAKAPVLIVVDGLVLAVMPPSVTSVAVNVAVPAVFGVTEKVCVPATSAALAGSVALASVEVMRNRVGGGDRVPVRVDRVDGDVEGAARGLRGRRAGLAGGGAGCGGLTGEEDLQLGEGAGVDRHGRARVGRLACRRCCRSR